MNSLDFDRKPEDTRVVVAMSGGVDSSVVAALAARTGAILIGATLQHIPNGWMFGAPRGGWEFPVLWTALLLVQAGLGAGAFALDVNRLLGRQVIPANA